MVTLNEAYTFFNTGPVVIVNNFRRRLGLGAYALRYSSIHCTLSWNATALGCGPLELVHPLYIIMAIVKLMSDGLRNGRRLVAPADVLDSDSETKPGYGSDRDGK